MKVEFRKIADSAGRMITNIYVDGKPWWIGYNPYDFSFGAWLERSRDEADKRIGEAEQDRDEYQAVLDFLNER